MLDSLALYLRERDEHEQCVLLHAGQPELRAVARESDVPEIEIEVDEAPRGVDREVSELALELGASSIEFAIDRPSLVRHPRGRPIHTLSAREAERGRDGCAPRTPTRSNRCPLRADARYGHRDSSGRRRSRTCRQARGHLLSPRTGRDSRLARQRRATRRATSAELRGLLRFAALGPPREEPTEVGANVTDRWIG